MQANDCQAEWEKEMGWCGLGAGHCTESVRQR